MSDREERIRQHAYRIWQEEGTPDGQARRHWEMAEELVAQEEGVSLTTEPNPMREEAPPREEPVEPPEALENQGDFPTLTDQGKGTVPPKRARSGSTRQPRRRPSAGER